MMSASDRHTWEVFMVPREYTLPGKDAVHFEEASAGSGLLDPVFLHLVEKCDPPDAEPPRGLGAIPSTLPEAL